MTSGNRKRTGHSTFRFQADIYLARFSDTDSAFPHHIPAFRSRTSVHGSEVCNRTISRFTRTYSYSAAAIYDIPN